MYHDHSRALKNCRTTLGFSQPQMAEALGVPKKTYQHWEQGRGAPETALKLAKRTAALRAIHNMAVSGAKGEEPTDLAEIADLAEAAIGA